ncbi:hypothetical protein GOV04_01030 [Candidatus Woesearchaeota archaeon]|nr:hypothetical protein [Candidatus Woesearchaeota archaeon]
MKHVSSVETAKELAEVCGYWISGSDIEKLAHTSSDRIMNNNPIKTFTIQSQVLSESYCVTFTLETPEEKLVVQRHYDERTASAMEAISDAVNGLNRLVTDPNAGSPVYGLSPECKPERSSIENM